MSSDKLSHPVFTLFAAPSAASAHPASINCDGAQFALKQRLNNDVTQYVVVVAFSGHIRHSCCVLSNTAEAACVTVVVFSRTLQKLHVSQLLCSLGHSRICLRHSCCFFHGHNRSCMRHSCCVLTDTAEAACVTVVAFSGTQQKLHA